MWRETPELGREGHRGCDGQSVNKGKTMLLLRKKKTAFPIQAFISKSYCKHTNIIACCCFF